MIYDIFVPLEYSNTSELVTVYRDCIRPLIEYADVTWHLHWNNLKHGRVFRGIM